jgi:hypothetical protein
VEWDRTCPVVDAAIGASVFRDHSSPRSTVPNERPEEGQQEANNRASGDPCDRASTQPTKQKVML